MDALSVGREIDCTGCITTALWIQGQTLREIETRLGYRPNRLAAGAFIGLMIEKLPKASEFNFLGYTNVAEHHHKSPDGLDINALKDGFLKGGTWGLGLKTPVKVFPVQRAEDGFSNDENYPPGSGVPQWKLTQKQRFRIVAFAKGNERVNLSAFVG